MTRQTTPPEETEQATIGLPIPVPDASLFRHTATDDLLRLLLDNPDEQFTIRELSRLTDNAAQSVKRAVDVLEANDLVTVEYDGNRRLVGVNRSRATIPTDPVLRVPQPEFQQPIRAALERLQTELEQVHGIVLFGSVARGEADRQSDIDLWVLTGDQGVQHQANQVAKALGQQRFDGDRYEFQILVESPRSARNQADKLTDVFTDAITLVESDELDELKQLVLSDA